MKMNPLNKRLKRDLRENIGRYLAIAIMFITTIMFVSAYLVVADSVKYTIEENKITNNLEDGQFTLDGELSEAQEAAVEALGVTVFHQYYTNIELDEKTTLRLYASRTEVDKESLLSGDLPDAKGETAIDRVFANRNHIQIGDTVGGLKVTGYVSLPDYTSLYENNNDIMLNTVTFGVGVVTEEELKSQGKLFYCYTYRTDAHQNGSTEELSKKDGYELGKKIGTTLYLNGAHVTNLIIQQNNQAICFLIEDMGSDTPLMKLLLYIILGIMAFVFAIVIKHTIEKESVIIGTLMASGYSKHELLRHYMMLPVIVTLISAVIGNILGYTVMINPFLGLYRNTYSIPNCQIRMNVEAFLLTTIVPMLMIVTINYLTLFRTLSISPLCFLRQDLKRSGNRGAVKLPKFTFFTRFRIRVLFQNIPNYIMLFIGIFLASFLLLFGIGMMPVVKNYTNSLDKSMLADYQYSLNQSYEVEGGNKATLIELSIYNKDMGDNAEVIFYGLDEVHGNELTEDEILFSDVLLKLQRTDLTEALNFINEYTEKEYVVKATDQIEYKAGMIVVMKRSVLNEMMDLDQDYYNAYLSDTALDIPSEFVTKTITANDMSKIAEQMLSSMIGMIPMIVFVAVIIYFVLMYILTKLVVDKNALAISFMKVFGYRNEEIRKLYLNAGILVVIASLILCIPLEKIGVDILITEAMRKTGTYMEVQLDWYLFVVIILTGMASYLIINRLHVRRVNRIPMTDALKTRE